MLKELDFTKQSLNDFWFGVKGMFFEDVTEESRRLVKALLERTLEWEFSEYVEVKRHERSERRKDYRNGYWTRDLVTTWGLLKDIPVPRGRKRGFEPRTFERYKRVHRRVDEGVLKMFLMGVSTPKVADVLEALFDYTLSAAYVSKLAKRLDGEVNSFFDRSLKDELTYLFLDGITVKVKDISQSVKRMILVAYGIRPDGSRQLIDFRVGRHEGKGSWTSFLHSLKVRGLTGSKLRLIISDGCAGLWAATEEVYPFVESRRRRDWVHKLRNVANPAAGGTAGNTSSSASLMLAKSTSRLP
jgi:putative transposase